MQFDYKDCIFITVDAQRIFFDGYLGATKALGALESLRERFAAQKVAMCQVHAEIFAFDDMLGDDAAERQHHLQRLLPELPGETLIGKFECAPMDNPQFEDMLLARRPRAVVLGGNFLDVCVLGTARHAQDILFEATGQDPAVFIATDCGLAFDNLNGLTGTQGAKIHQIKSADISFGQNGLSIGLPQGSRPVFVPSNHLAPHA